MAVMREEDDLGLLSNFGEDLEAGSRAVIVEVDEQVVNDQRQRLRAIDLLLDRGESERQVKLVTRSLAHPVNRDLDSSATPAKQDHVAALIEPSGQPGVAGTGDLGEDVARSRE